MFLKYFKDMETVNWWNTIVVSWQIVICFPEKPFSIADDVFIHLSVYVENEHKNIKYESVKS